MRPAARAAVAAVLAALTALAGCSSGPAGSADDADAAAPDTSAYTDGSRVPNVVNERDIPELPVARYEFGDSDTERHSRAQARAAQRCMVGFGFTDFPLDPGSPDLPKTVYSMVAVAMATPFGELDLGEARRWGYGWDPKMAGAVDAAGAGFGKGRAMTDAEDQVFYNAGGSTDRTVNGREVPENGCSGQAAARLTEGVEDATRMWTYTSKRSQVLAAKTLKDPDVSEALRTWARCVEDRGLTRYEGREDAFRDKAWHRDDNGNTRRTQRERDTAVADIECAREHNTVGVWWAGEARSQTADIESHRATYEAVRRDQDVVRANIRDVLGN
ncbi:hypothetical protein [Streptomyces sp. NBC_01508]|uniref:hypothetical protein n=1 Tax=Streptomyces sp. NBC_01508 TaxID=2903888 RepID=UPI00386FCD5A